jgi:hypothetical protein
MVGLGLAVGSPASIEIDRPCRDASSSKNLNPALRAGLLSFCPVRRTGLLSLRPCGTGPSFKLLSLNQICDPQISSTALQAQFRVLSSFRMTKKVARARTLIYICRSNTGDLGQRELVSPGNLVGNNRTISSFVFKSETLRYAWLKGSSTRRSLRSRPDSSGSFGEGLGFEGLSSAQTVLSQCA